MTSQAIKNKRAGANFEGKVRKVLRNNGQFVYTKGVSSKGIDILSMKNDKVIFLELKSYIKLNKSNIKNALNQFIINDKIVCDFVSRTQYNENQVFYGLLTYERNNKLCMQYVNGEMELKIKKKSIDIELNLFLIDQIKEQFKLVKI